MPVTISRISGVYRQSGLSLLPSPVVRRLEGDGPPLRVLRHQRDRGPSLQRRLKENPTRRSPAHYSNQK